MPPVQIGETMRAGGIATVLKTGGQGNLKAGDLVYGGIGERDRMRFEWLVLMLLLGWSEYTVLKEKTLEKIECVPSMFLRSVNDWHVSDYHLEPRLSIS